MTYVLVGILFLLVVGGLVLALTMRATAGSTPASPESDDASAVGDTPQHSDAESAPPSTPGPVEPGEGRFKRDPVGGEAEAETTIDTRNAT
jgi:hypothetical protein